MNSKKLRYGVVAVVGLLLEPDYTLIIGGGGN
jgi:hypothetical protein